MVSGLLSFCSWSVSRPGPCNILKLFAHLEERVHFRRAALEIFFSCSQSLSEEGSLCPRGPFGQPLRGWSGPAGRTRHHAWRGWLGPGAHFCDVEHEHLAQLVEQLPTFSILQQSPAIASSRRLLIWQVLDLMRAPSVSRGPRLILPNQNASEVDDTIPIWHSHSGALCALLHEAHAGLVLKDQA